MTADSILDEAKDLVHGPRAAAYDHPSRNFQRIANLFNALYPNRPAMTSTDVAMFMICVKLSREAHLHKRDNLVDMAGYAETIDMIHKELFS